MDIYMTAEENPRVGLAEGEINKDSDKVRLYDHHFDMYIDEFDDADDDFISVG